MHMGLLHVLQIFLLSHLAEAVIPLGENKIHERE